MDRVLIEQKLESLRRCVAQVAAKCPAGIETLANDAGLQDIVVLDLTRAVQLCVDLDCRNGIAGAGNHGTNLRFVEPGGGLGARFGRTHETGRRIS